MARAPGWLRCSEGEEWRCASGTNVFGTSRGAGCHPQRCVPVGQNITSLTNSSQTEFICNVVSVKLNTNTDCATPLSRQESAPVWEPELVQRSTKGAHLKASAWILGEPPCRQELTRCWVAWGAPSLRFFCLSPHDLPGELALACGQQLKNASVQSAHPPPVTFRLLAVAVRLPFAPPGEDERKPILLKIKRNWQRAAHRSRWPLTCTR